MRISLKITAATLLFSCAVGSAPAVAGAKGNCGGTGETCGSYTQDVNGVYGNTVSRNGDLHFQSGTAGTLLTVTSTGGVGVGTTSPATKLQINGTALIGNGGETCSATYAGGVRYNSGSAHMEYCNGLAWLPFNVSGAPAGSGYFVVTQTTYTGNLGGLAGANSACLTELTTKTTWWGYSSANAAGLLVSGHVKGFLCDGTTCNNPNASTKYYFANVADPGAGGGYFTTDGSGLGPNDSQAWGYAAEMSRNTGAVGGYVFTGRGVSSATQWASTSNSANCLAWTSSSYSDYGEAGYPTTVGNGTRWAGTAAACGYAANLYCLVNP